jgi:hypothetical protein
VPEGLPWYTPGMREDRKPPVQQWILALTIGLPVLYVLSWAPAELSVTKMGEPEWLVVPGKAIYAPLAWLQYHVPEPVDQAYEAYVRWWISILGEP